MFTRSLILLFAVLVFAPAGQAQGLVDECLNYERIDPVCQERLGLVEPLVRFKQQVTEVTTALGLVGEQAFVVTNYDNVQAPRARYQRLSATLATTALMPTHLFYVQMSVLKLGGAAMEYAAINVACQAFHKDASQKLDDLLEYPPGYHAFVETSVENQCVRRLTGDDRFSIFMTPVNYYNIAGRS